MKNRIGIVICYFGALPSMFNVWYESCKKNTEFDFLLFTDQNVNDVSENIIVYNCSLSYVAELAAAKLHLNFVELSAPYKLCDYKPMYGTIFEDYLWKYDFWGMCDMDAGAYAPRR